jgi:hypothetical protein
MGGQVGLCKMGSFVRLVKSYRLIVSMYGRLDMQFILAFVLSILLELCGLFLTMLEDGLINGVDAREIDEDELGKDEIDLVELK